MTELHDLTGLQQASAIRRAEVSAVELAEHYLARVDRLGDQVGAFITVTADQAMHAAKQADDTVRRNADGSGDRSADLAGLPPLLGVPTAIKDLNLTAGVRTTFGSATYEDFVPELSDEVVLRLERAGLISLGKTNTPEFGSPCYTEPDVAPPARTPYDLARSAGGSSGGAGAAVAAGLVPWAQGSDGGGSIRIPASVCGLVGLKPSRGRISGAPLYGDPVGLATPGPLTRTVRDAAAMLDVLEGPHPGDHAWAPPLPAGEDYTSWCERDPGRLRVARFVTPLVAEAEVHPECRAAYESASRLLDTLGHDVVDIPAPLSPDAVPVFETCWAVLTGLSVVPTDRVDRLRPLTRWLMDRAAEVSAVDFGLALGELRRIAARALEALASYDVVLTPTLAALPAPVGSLRDDADPSQDFENQKTFTPYTSAWNVTGMPAVSLPLHWTDDGLPVGVMLAARPAEEHLLLALSAQMEAAAPWHDRLPSCW
ncbi:MAG: amidase [Nocardioidaceae bacterium]